MTYDMNDAELPRGTDLIPDGTFVKVMMINPPRRRRRPGRGRPRPAQAVAGARQ